MPRPIKAYISPRAVKNNLEVIRQRASDERVWAVVKANAYGHGSNVSTLASNPRMVSRSLTLKKQCGFGCSDGKSPSFFWKASLITVM